MRAIRTHTAANGTVTFKVRFRLHGHQSSETFTSERKAERFAKELDAVGPVAALERLYAGKPVTTGPTVDALAEEFFEWKVKRVRSDRTVSDYRRDYHNWIAPTFGGREADTIGETAIQQWVDAMGEGALGNKLSPKSVADRHAILHAIYLWAIAPVRKLVTYDPCLATDLPPRTKKPPKGLRPAEWQALQPALAQTDPDGADLAEFLLASGWRISEASALSAFAVEDYGDDQPMWVTMAQVVRRNAKGQFVIVEDAKSAAGEGRRSKLDAHAAAIIRRRLKKVSGDGLVFTNANGKQWHYSNYLNRIWNPAVELAGLSRRPTPHWLRHTHVFWLILGGKANIAEIQARVGHEDINTTIGVYGRMIDDVSVEALEAFDAFRTKALTPPARPVIDA